MGGFDEGGKPARTRLRAVPSGVIAPGEALYFGKPVFAIPEDMHHEQQINAHFLRQMGAGDWTTAESFQANQFANFLSRLDEYRQNLSQRIGTANGTLQSLAIVESVLQQGRPSSKPARVESNTNEDSIARIG